MHIIPIVIIPRRVPQYELSYVFIAIIFSVRIYFQWCKYSGFFEFYSR